MQPDLKINFTLKNMVMKDFIDALKPSNKKAYRMHFDMGNGKIGIAAAYTNKDNLKALRVEAELIGYKFIKIVED